MQRRKGGFPQPLGPTMHTVSCSSTVKSRCPNATPSRPETASSPAALRSRPSDFNELPGEPVDAFFAVFGDDERVAEKHAQCAVSDDRRWLHDQYVARPEYLFE